MACLKVCGMIDDFVHIFVAAYYSSSPFYYYYYYLKQGHNLYH